MARNNHIDSTSIRNLEEHADSGYSERALRVYTDEAGPLIQDFRVIVS